MVAPVAVPPASPTANERWYLIGAIVTFVVVMLLYAAMPTQWPDTARWRYNHEGGLSLGDSMDVAIVGAVVSFLAALGWPVSIPFASYTLLVYSTTTWVKVACVAAIVAMGAGTVAIVKHRV